MLWMVLFMPFTLILLALAIDGLSMAATYQRAMGLARVGAQAGAGAVEFDGSNPRLSGQACQVATDTVRYSTTNVVVGATGNNYVLCQSTVRSVNVLVRLKVFRLFSGPISIPFEYVVATAKAEPRFGINGEEK